MSEQRAPGEGQPDPELEQTHPTPAGQDPSLVVGRYRILRTLGKGGGGQVWLAQDEHLGREVSLKRVGGETDTDLLITRGLREARTLATIAHDHVVRVYDTFEHEGAPWIVMEYVPGPSLADLLTDGSALPVGTVAVMGAQLATALAAAHQAGIIHRDVKPGNVLLTDDSGSQAKLTDFGIARAQDDHQLTQTGLVSGTAAYFSPELARGEDPSPASDVWALGATLYAAVEGRRPFPDQPNAVAQLHTIVREVPRRPVQAGVLTPVLAGMLDGDPRSRWSAAQVAQALTEIAARAPRGEALGPHSIPPDSSHSATGGPHSPSWPASARSRSADDTQRHGGVDGTAALPVRGAEHRPQTPGTAPPAPRRGRGRVLTWLLVIPLLAALGWLVWTIVDTGGADRDAGGNVSLPTTATPDEPVSANDAEQLVRYFYSALVDEGLAAARVTMVDGVPVPEDIADGLLAVEVRSVEVTEPADGITEVVAIVAYEYAPETIVQREEMQVARRGADAKIIRRAATSVVEP